jgi:aromatic-L-amino-acid decarboxylase
LISARERATDYGLARGGLQAESQPLVVYVTEHAHSSVSKAALLAGFGRENVRVVAHDAAYAMAPGALASAIAADRAAGRVPCAIVCTTGSTTSTAWDPLTKIGGLAAQHGLWLHVDSAMAGSAMILPECRYMWAGVERADSIVINPHKWMGVPFDASVYFVRDPEHLVRVMSTNPSYLRSSVDERVKNYRDWGIPLGRRFRALKLWFLIREAGVAGLQARIRRDLANAARLAGLVEAAPGWRLLAPVRLQTLSLRHEPFGLAGEALDRHTLAWVEAINRSGAAYLTPAMLDGRWMVRVSIGAEPTEWADVEALWEVMRDLAEATAAARG